MKKQKKGIKLNPCVKCGKVFNKSYKLTDHIKNCVPTRCAICGKEYKSLKSMQTCLHPLHQNISDVCTVMCVTWRRINRSRLHVKYVEKSIAEMNTSRPIEQETSSKQINLAEFN